MGGIRAAGPTGGRVAYGHLFPQFGGPDGELSASMRYLAQRYTMPYKECKATLTDIGTEELAHGC